MAQKPLQFLYTDLVHVIQDRRTIFPERLVSELFYPRLLAQLLHETLAMFEFFASSRIREDVWGFFISVLPLPLERLV